MRYTATLPKIGPIIKDVADRHGLSVDDLTGHSRKARLVIARHEAQYLCVEAGYSRNSVAYLFNDRDHTTVCHAIKRHEERMKTGLA